MSSESTGSARIVQVNPKQKKEAPFIPSTGRPRRYNWAWRYLADADTGEWESSSPRLPAGKPGHPSLRVSSSSCQCQGMREGQQQYKSATNTSLIGTWLEAALGVGLYSENLWANAPTKPSLKFSLSSCRWVEDTVGIHELTAPPGLSYVCSSSPPGRRHNFRCCVLDPLPWSWEASERKQKQMGKGFSSAELRAAAELQSQEAPRVSRGLSTKAPQHGFRWLVD